MSAVLTRRTHREQQARTWFDSVHPDDVARAQQIAVDEAATVSPAYAQRLRLRQMADAQALREKRGEKNEVDARGDKWGCVQADLPRRNSGDR